MRTLPLAAVALLFVSGASAPLRGAPPNFVFIMADDLGWADVGFHGGVAPTPRLDRLAQENRELTQHYVAPVCSPTRAGLLTGRYWSRFDVTSPQNTRALPWNVVTLPRVLKEAGYDTCLAGKWHLGSRPEWGPGRFGFDHSYGSLAGGVGPWTHFYKRGPYSRTWHRNGELLAEPGHVTDLITAEAVRWIGSRSQRPFFLYVPFTAVHLPVDEPAVWLDRVPPNVVGDVPRHYVACIMHLDDAVGRIVDALDEAGHRENTLLVFTSDNGGSTASNNDQRYPDGDYPEGPLPGDNRPLRGRKGQLYEGGIRVPTIASWPGRLPAGPCDVPLHITDWAPTFCAAAQTSPAQTSEPHSLAAGELAWDGADVGPILAGRAPEADRPLYWVAPNYRARAVRLGDWKLILSGDDARPRAELFNLAADPGEAENLAASMPEKVASLTATWRRLAAADGRDAVRDDP